MLIAIPVYDTEENQRTQLTRQTLTRLAEIVRRTDRVVVSDNGSCQATQDLYVEMSRVYNNLIVLKNGRNLGIAGGANVAWKQFGAPGEILVKMDNDCIINTPGWPELVDYVFAKQPDIGILALKRHDLAECPTSTNPFYKSTLSYIAHEPGERWVVVEDVKHAVGTCYAFNPLMLPKFGYLMQPDTTYGFDDAIAAARARKLGFRVCFLPQIDIDHIDVLGIAPTDPYIKWKQAQAGQGMARYHQIIAAIENGSVSPYYDGGF